MIIENYVSFETAKLLKEKGFHEKVNHVYHYYTSAPFYRRHLRDFNGEDYKNLRHEHYSAPTLQMAMKWLREVHCIFIELQCYGVENKFNYSYVINLQEHRNYGVGDIAILSEKKAKAQFNTYEEAAECGIKYVLENLI